MVGVYLFAAVLSATKALAATHYNIINACPSAITLYINGASQGLLSANGGITTRDFEDNFSGVIYTDANGGHSDGTSTTLAGFVGQVG